MRRLLLLPLLMGPLLVAPACSEPGGDVVAEAAAPAPVEEGAFCREHGVAEAVCTRCNPKLVAIFKDKGDWCTEHDFPESFCPTCKPELGGKPAVDLAEGAPPDGTLVQLASERTAKLAGIETEPAREGVLAGHVEVLGAITWDETRHAQVNARLPGVVKELLVTLGARVEAGAPLVRVESAELGALRARRQAAEARIAAAEPALDRARKLQERGLGALQDVQAAQRELDEARAARAEAQSALELLGPVPEQGNVYALTAPLAGTCVAVSAVAGRLVSGGETLCELVDTRSVWAVLEVPETELAHVAAGQAVTVRADVLGAREFSGTVDHVAPQIDPHTRTAKARVRLANPDGALRANLQVRARIVTAAGEARVLVPRDAVQRARGQDFVFVQLAADRFEARRASVAGADGELVALARGAKAGERVATRGSFLLKTEILKGDIGAGCCVDEAAD
jgi:cobalt-zinc-cadmium efflux system membrane fusion protein